MDNKTFEKLFNSLLGYNKFKVKESQPPEFNITQFQKMAFLQHNCKFLYDNLSNLYGEEYGEKIITGVIKGKFTISNPENFTYKDKLYVKDTLFMMDFMTYNNLNVLSAIGEMAFILNNNGKYVDNLISPDTLIILSMYVKKFMSTKQLSGALFNNNREKYWYLQTLLKTFLKTVAVKKGEENKLTLGILDKKTFNYLIANKDYHLSYADMGKVYTLRPLYAEYIKVVKLFIKAYNRFKGGILPKLVYYIYPTKSLKDLVRAKITEYLNINRLFVGIALHNLYIGEETDFDSPEYENALTTIIARAKKDVSVEELKSVARQVIEEGISNSADRVDLTNLPLMKYMKKFRQQAKPYLLLYDRKNYKDVFKPKISEVSLDFSMIKDELLTVDELMQRLVEAYIDAQAINQARLSIVKTNKYIDCRCNVIIKNVDDTLIPTVFNELEQQTKFLKSTYGVDFTFEIENKQN